MKFLTVALALMAASSVQAVKIDKWCSHPGQGCYMMKRTADASFEAKGSAEALADAMAEANTSGGDKWCSHPGQGCNKFKRAVFAVDEVKRSADALAEAIAAFDEE